MTKSPPPPLPHYRPTRRVLVLTLDAFSTIYAPRSPIPAQYLSLARKVGLPLKSFGGGGGSSGGKDGEQRLEQELNKAFKASFKEMSRRSPNYGRDGGMRPEEWWDGIVRGSFRGLITIDDDNHHQKKKKEESDITDTEESALATLSRKLYHHFSSAEGYTLFPDAERLFSHLNLLKNPTVRHHIPSVPPSKQPVRYGPETQILRYTPTTQIIVGVLTNSDPRAIDVLKSLGLKVSNITAADDEEVSPLPDTDPGDPAVAAPLISETESNDHGHHHHKQNKPNTIPTPTPATTTESTLSNSNSKPLITNLLPTDINLTITSYTASAVKPSPQIFNVAERLSRRLILSTHYEYVDEESSEEISEEISKDKHVAHGDAKGRHGGVSDGPAQARKLVMKPSSHTTHGRREDRNMNVEMTFLHVGDDWDADVEGAEGVGWKALFLDRSGGGGSGGGGDGGGGGAGDKGNMKKKDRDREGKSIKSLDDPKLLGMIEEFLRAGAGDGAEWTKGFARKVS